MNSTGAEIALPRADVSGQLLTLRDPVDRSRHAVWNGEAFVFGGQTVRVLAYAVKPSGWSDELTRLHEEVGGSDHFIDVASRLHALSEVERNVTRMPSVILEIGVSSGFLLRELVSALPGHVVVGSDYTRGTLDLVAQRAANVPLIQFDLTQCPLADGFADIVVLLNVLEHIEDHEGAISHLFRILRPGGTVIIEVPAGSSLFDVYDRALMHFRRYDMKAFVAVLRRAGFIIDRRSHLGFFLYPAFYLAKRLNQLRFPASAQFDEHHIVSKLIETTRKSGVVLKMLMILEVMLQKFVSFPVGVRCLVTCRKPAADEAR